MSIRVVFMGSPDFAVPVLANLAAAYPIVGVVTQPDRPAGRGQVLTAPAVKTLALQLGLEVFQPERLRKPEATAIVEAWAPDLIVVAAYGQILRPSILNLPRLGCINVHASLLPRWRGAAPIQAALLHGDLVSGATIMKMDSGIDTGDMLACQETPILPDDTTTSLSERLAEAGAHLLIATLPGYLNGTIQPYSQNSDLATYAPMIQKEEGELDFSQSAAAIVNRVRAFNPWPGAYIFWPNQALKIHAAAVSSAAVSTSLVSTSLVSTSLVSTSLVSTSLVSTSLDLAPGDHAIIEKMPAVRAADGWVLLTQVQPAGKKPMSGRDFLAGARGWLS